MSGGRSGGMSGGRSGTVASLQTLAIIVREAVTVRSLVTIGTTNSESQRQ